MIYLDHNATTPVDPAVAEKMAWVLREHFGNPSSLYPIGRRVKELLNEARERVAGSLGVDRGEIYFTGSGTESDNFAIFGTFEASPGRDEFVTSAIEHPAVIEAAKALEARGVKVTYLPVDAYGTVDLDQLRSRSDPEDGPRLDHARQQRDRHDPAHPGHRPDRPRARRRGPHRRRSDLRQDRRRRPEARGRLPVRFGPQDLRPQGRSAPSTSAAGRRSVLSSAAVARSGVSGPGPRTRPGSSGSARPSASSRRRAARSAPGSNIWPRRSRRASRTGSPARNSTVTRSTGSRALSISPSPGSRPRPSSWPWRPRRSTSRRVRPAARSPRRSRTSSGPSGCGPRSPARRSACPSAGPTPRRTSPSSFGNCRRSSRSSGPSRPSTRKAEPKSVRRGARGSAEGSSP